MQKLWGGTFSAETNTLVELLNNSLHFDFRLWEVDILGSLAHATMLGETGILTSEEAQTIIGGLESLHEDIHDGNLILPSDAEDIHTAIEGLLQERIGNLAGKLHTARSRNDQVATDFRLYLLIETDNLLREITELQRTLLNIAKDHFETVLPGYTHLQHAQPIVLAHHLLAYFWMLDRDKERFRDGRRRINRCPLGAGALAGTGFPIDRRRTSELLGFGAPLENSLDAVSDRDFALEFLASASILMTHISRLAEELILWNSQEFRFVVLDDTVTTGSSIMPQKKNPDVAELARGKSGRVFGSLMSLLTTMKGLTLAYNKDMQEDKEPVFDTVDTLSLLLPALNLTLETAHFRTDRMLAATHGDFSTATDLADFLAANGYTFREAHEIVGKVVRWCVENSNALEDLTAETLIITCPLKPELLDAALNALRVESSVRMRKSQGGTAPDAVREQYEMALARIEP